MPTMGRAFMAQDTVWNGSWAMPGNRALGQVPLRMGQDAGIPVDDMPLTAPKPIRRMPPPSTQPSAEAVALAQKLCVNVPPQGFAKGSPEAEAFWAEVGRSGLDRRDFMLAWASICPGAKEPRADGPHIMTREAKEARPEAEMPKAGFHGKAMISYDEAKELDALLDEALQPLTAEEQASAEEQHACRRELHAGPYPIVTRLQERLKTFLASAKPTDTFEISRGELQVTAKAVDCAIAIGRVRLQRTLVTAAGVGIPLGAAALLFLL